MNIGDIFGHFNELTLQQALGLEHIVAKPTSVTFQINPTYKADKVVVYVTKGKYNLIFYKRGNPYVSYRNIDKKDVIYYIEKETDTVLP